MICHRCFPFECTSRCDAPAAAQPPSEAVETQVAALRRQVERLSARVGALDRHVWNTLVDAP